MIAKVASIVIALLIILLGMTGSLLIITHNDLEETKIELALCRSVSESIEKNLSKKIVKMRTQVIYSDQAYVEAMDEYTELQRNSKRRIVEFTNLYESTLTQVSTCESSNKKLQNKNSTLSITAKKLDKTASELRAQLKNYLTTAVPLSILRIIDTDAPNPNNDITRSG